MEECQEDTLKPRLYQDQLGERSIQENTIIHLPTGSGKTYIAIMLIKRMKKDFQKPWKQGGKRAIFLVNNVPLVEQQKSVITKMAPVEVGGFSSENKVDFWKKSKWDEEISKHHVMVMTSQILLNMLMHDFIKLQDINLMIFDECHHAVVDHPMRLIMKMFELCPKNEQPRILGLTATLLNANVKLESIIKTIEDLETTFHATIATVNDMGEVLDYSTNPRELIINYITEPPGVTAMRAVAVLMNLKDCINGNRFKSIETSLNLNHYQEDISRDPHEINKKVANMVEDGIKQITELGVFGGSLAVLAYQILLERIRRRCDTVEANQFFQYVSTHLQMARALLEHEMRDRSGYAKIIKYSSKHVHVMLDVLKEFNKNKFEKNEEGEVEKEDERMSVNKNLSDLCAIIFAQKRFTCKILYNLLKAVKETNPQEFEFIKHDFIVGFNVNPYNNTREELFEKKYSQSALLKFGNKEINLLIATSVIEEGVDIPRCSLVLRYDCPQEYRSYIQSKGRARSKTSNYVMLVDRKDDAKFRKKYETFQICEQHIQNVLVGKHRQGPTHEKIVEELYNDAEIPPFVLPSGACISEASAISLLNQYCSILPQDQFTEIAPTWILERQRGQRQVTIYMPINCPIKEPIKGMPMYSLKSAKRSAALNTCIKLFEAGELDPESALPKRYASLNFEQPDVKEIFLNWDDETIVEHQHLPGTKKRIRKHDKVYPKCFEGVSDFKYGTRTFYMHLITLKPAFTVPEDSRERALYKLLEMDEGYAVLTANPMPRLCDFPMFLGIGEVRTSLEVNYGTVTLDREKFDSVKEFHHLVFDKILDVAKKFVAFEGAVNAAYVVPVAYESVGAFDIDWKVIHTYKDIAPVVCPTDEERRNIRITGDYHYAVVTPWYRGTLLPDRYIVSNILKDTTVQSPFEKENGGTYEDYYASKYSLNILGPLNQPLLEVKQISGPMTCLLPRASTIKALSGKQLRLAMAAQGDDKPSTFKENLVPEFCIKYDFPGVLWYKATILPSILHRVSMLLVANDLRMEICKSTKLGSPTLAQSQRWKPITINLDVTTNSLLAYADGRSPEVRTIDRINCPPEGGETSHPIKINSMRDNIFRLQMNKLNKEYPWDEKKEPMDIERNLTLVTLMDIECYDKFMVTTLDTDKPKPAPLSPSANKSATAICPPPLKYNERIELLSRKQTIRGLELFDLLTSLTSIKSSDTFNLERTETLGDSFLKFAATLYLYHKFPALNEGQLTNIKCRLIGNRNLFYAGRRVNLGGRIKVERFSPLDDFVLPAFSVPKPISDFIRNQSIRPTFLFNVKLDRSEQLSGKVSPKTMAEVQSCYYESKMVENETEDNVQVPMQCYLDKQAVPDKMIADCVESLVGVYVVSCGLTGGVRILEWLRVLPPSDNFESYLTRRVTTALTEGKTRVQDIELLLNHNRSEVEDILGYKFKDPSLLLEALSHPSFNTNRVTRSYERLEFLGDAVLDFLITAHIYEHCGELKPGDLTDLRSALVNNVTFAGYVVKLGLHKYMLSQINPTLDRAIMTFAEHQEQRQHQITEDVLYLIDEEDCKIAQYIEVPKILSDLFESLAGAMFLDSGGDLQLVWSAYYAIMCREIDNFSKNIPIQPVRMLRERIHACPHFGKVKQVSPDKPIIMAPVTVTVNGRVLNVHGFGSNKRQAQRAAAKLALKNLECAAIYIYI